MADKEEDKELKKLLNPHFIELEEGDEGEEGEGGSGAQGHVEFHDFLAPAGPSRDDLLSPDEIKRLFAVNKDLHELHVIKQKAQLENRKALKEGKINYQQYQQNLAAAGIGGESPYRPNPALENQIQFAGIEKQENPLANINEAETNNDNRNELDQEYRLTNRLQLQAQPKFNPRPKPG